MSKTIEEIYIEHKILSKNRERMYRTASVASIICDHFPGTLDRKSILNACLLYKINETHMDTLAIAQDLGSSLRTLEILQSMLSASLKEISISEEIEKKICFYSRLRVGEQGVISLDEKVDSLQKKYGSHFLLFSGIDEKVGQQILSGIENTIFENSSITSDFINEKNVQELVSNLKSTHIH